MKRTFLFSLLFVLILTSGFFTFGSFNMHYAHADTCSDDEGCQNGYHCDVGNTNTCIQNPTSSGYRSGSTDNYELLVPLPIGNNSLTLGSLPTGSNGTAVSPGLATYIAGMYKLFIALSAVIAVVMIVYGGILYMSTDAIYNKTEGKTIIIRTLWGLLLIIGSYVILNTINPTLLSLSGTSVPASTLSTTSPAVSATSVSNTSNVCIDVPSTGLWNLRQRCLGNTCYGPSYIATDASNYNQFISYKNCLSTLQTCLSSGSNPNTCQSACSSDGTGHQFQAGFTFRDADGTHSNSIAGVNYDNASYEVDIYSSSGLFIAAEYPAPAFTTPGPGWTACDDAMKALTSSADTGSDN